MNQEEIMERLQAGMLALQAGNLDAAQQVFSSILEVDSKEIHSLHFLGVVACQKGDISSGVSLMENSIALDPSRFGPFLNLGHFLVSDGQYQRAISILKEAVKRDETSFEAWNLLSQANFKCDELKEAASAGRAACNLSPDNAEPFFNLGIYLSAVDEYDEAITAYKYALDRKPDYIEAWVNLGNLHNDAKRFGLAIEFYRKAIELNPDCAEAYLNLGNVLKKETGVEEAIESYRKAIEVKPDFADPYFALGLVLKYEGELEEAIASCRKAIDLKPDFTDAWSLLAQCLMESGRVSESLDAFEKCSQLNPWDPSFYEEAALSCYSYERASGDAGLRSLADGLYEKSFHVRPLISRFDFTSNSSNSGSIPVSNVIQSLPTNAELLPSYKSLIGHTYLSLYYLHIPKSGGLRFTIPLQECIRLFENSLFDGKFDYWKALVDLRCEYNRLTSLRLNNKSLHEAFLNNLSADEPDQSIDWSLVMSHGSWSSLELQKRIADVTGQMPIRVGAWRDPRKRFLSALHYLYREAGGSVERVAKDLSDKASFLDNAIYRYVADCIEGELTEPPEESAADYLLDLGDHSLLSQLQSSFLSRNRLPNLIVSKHFNITRSDFCMSDEDESRLLSEFSIEEFVHLDASDYVNSIRVSELSSDLGCEPVGEELHPLTVIVSDSTRQSSSVYKSEIFLTSDLVGERGRQRLQSIFAGKNT